MFSNSPLNHALAGVYSLYYVGMNPSTPLKKLILIVTGHVHSAHSSSPDTCIVQTHRHQTRA